MSLGAAYVGNFSSPAGDTTPEQEASASAFDLPVDHIVLVCCKWEDTDTTCTVTDTAGNTYVSLGHHGFETDDEDFNESFVCLSSTANATNVIKMTLGTSSNDYLELSGAYFSYTGTAAEVGDTGQGGSATDTTPWTSDTTLSAVAGDIVYAGLSWWNLDYWDDDWDVLGAANTAQTHSEPGYLIPVGSYSDAPGGTPGTSNSYVIITAVIQEASAGQSIVPLVVNAHGATIGGGFIHG